MKITIDGWICAQQYQWDTEPTFTFFGFKPNDDSSWHAVAPHSVEFELPDDFDIRSFKINALLSEKDKARADFAKRVEAIDKQISELQALTFDAKEVAE